MNSKDFSKSKYKDLSEIGVQRKIRTRSVKSRSGVGFHQVFTHRRLQENTIIAINNRFNQIPDFRDVSETAGERKAYNQHSKDNSSIMTESRTCTKIV